MTLNRIFNKISTPILILVLGITSCDPSGGSICDEVDRSIYQTPVAFQLQSSVGQNLIGAVGAIYENDDVIVHDENGGLASNLYVQNDGTISFTFIQVDHELEEERSRRFYLYLPPTTDYPQIDRDTIDLTYTLSRSEPCGHKTTKNFNIRYNDLPQVSDMFPSKLTFIKE